MSIANKTPLPLLNGRVVESAVSGVDSTGYGFVELRFTNGDVLNIHEVGQCGEIEWRMGREPSEPR